MPLGQWGTGKRVAGVLAPTGSIYHESMQMKHDDLINQMMESKSGIKS